MKRLKQLPEFVRFVMVASCDSSALRIVFCITTGYQCKHSLYTGICSQLHRQFLSDCLLYLRPEALMEKSLGFGGAHLCSYLLHMGLLNLSLWMGIPKPLAPIPVFAIAIPVNFLLVRFVFKRKSDNLFFSRFLTNIAKRFVL